MGRRALYLSIAIAIQIRDLIRNALVTGPFNGIVVSFLFSEKNGLCKGIFGGWRMKYALSLLLINITEYLFNIFHFYKI